MKSLTLIFLLCAALLLAACGGSSNQTNGGNAGGDNKGGANAGGTTKTETKTETKGSDTSTAAVTGVAACDEYIAKVEKCMNNPKWPVSEQVRTTYKQSLEQNRAAWKQAASTPAGKEVLEGQCKAALQAAAAVLDTCQ